MTSAFDEGVKLALSQALKERAAAAAKGRLGSLKDLLDTPLSRGARGVAEGNYERLARKVPAFEGISKTHRGMRADIARIANDRAANAGTVLKAPAEQATRVARGRAVDATKVVPPPVAKKRRVPTPKRSGGMGASIFAAGAAGGLVAGGRRDAAA